MSKKLLYAIVFLTVAFFISLNFIDFGFAKSKHDGINPAFRQYISAFSSGYISTESPLRIILANDAKGEVETGTELENNLFSISPKIEGKMVWVDKRTIEFKPAEKLKNGQDYEVGFKLGKVMDVPSDLSEFNFGVRTIPQAIEIAVVDYQVTSESTYDIVGLVNTADAATNEAIEKCLFASQGSGNLKLVWNHESSTSHRFTVVGVKRMNEQSNLSLVVNGEAISSTDNYIRDFSIPKVGEFGIIEVRVDNDPEQVLQVIFTDNLQNNQNLSGLFGVSGATENSGYYGEGEPRTITFTNSVSGNKLRIYPSSRITGDRVLSLEGSIRNAKGRSLGEGRNYSVTFEEIKPAVRLKGKGVILPNTNGLIFPFEAVNLNAIDVKITRVFENNILQFLQINGMDGNRELRRVGKTVFKKKVDLGTIGTINRNKWNRYALDLSRLIQTEPGAIYNVSINFKKAYAQYDCAGDTLAEASSQYGYDPEAGENAGATEEEEKDWDYYSSYYYDDYEDGYYYYYDYRQRDNPCSRAYYSYNRSVNRNVLASNLGLMAKRGMDGKILVVSTDLISAKPVSGIEVEAFDFQQQSVAKGKSNGDGITVLESSKKPFVIVAKRGMERAYIKLEDGLSNSLSMFEVGGEYIQKGLKGFIYGERGVWRPGDTLFLSFMLEDKEGRLPEKHPVSFELQNPQGKVIQHIVKSENVGGIYSFTTKTDAYDPTGIYLAKVKVGGATFTKNIRVETIMPNRLKLNLDFHTDKLLSGAGVMSGDLNVRWLHGAPGRNLNSKIDLTLNPTETTFKNYKGYIFDNPASGYYSETKTVFEGRTDESGNTKVDISLGGANNAPGFLNASFTVRAFEEGGAFSTDRFSIPYSPYSHYVGVKIPSPGKESSWLETDVDHSIKIASVDEKGNPANRNINVKIYKVSWRWWWDDYSDDLNNYVGSNYHQPVYSEDMVTRNGQAQFNFRINYPEWGRYLIYVTDKESGHSSGSVMYLDWPSWKGKSPKGNEGASMLSFATDKGEYKVGDEVKVTIPSSKNGNALISIENGTRVVKSFWLETKDGSTDFSFKVTSEMSPNVYIYATLIQPHNQTLNDLPIRLYGIVPISVKDENTILSPQLICADVWKPESKASVKVKETNGKEMFYTLAVVDEGLLDITRFKTPDPWSSFYAREALGVKTWDVFDLVIGAFSGGLQRILSIGGDGDANSKSGNKAQRFKPMVRFVGPFKLSKGETAEHKIDIPRYVGAVRVMVVAANKGAYGNGEKSVFVRKPLMILGTLPRLVGPDEEVELPVTVFAMEKNVKQATVTVSTDKFFRVLESNSKTVQFTEPGDQVVPFRLKVSDLIGVSKVKIKAQGGGETATEEIEIEIRSPNPPITDVGSYLVDAGKGISFDYQALGIKGTNKAVIEISSMPPMDLQRRSAYLIQYPHGCVEQTTSAAFGQLVLEDLMELSASQKSTIEANIKAAINRLKSFQTGNGGLSYWPGMSTADEWGSNYAGHFLIEAQKKGYKLPYGLLDNWKKYQKERARSWSLARNSVKWQEDVTQAYRLYTLALAGSAELGAMNKLKENKTISISAKWRLAAAYALAGQKESAKTIVAGIPARLPQSSYDYWYTYGSYTRDEAMMLEAMSLIGMKKEGFETLQDICKDLAGADWMSTQTTAYSLLAVAHYVKNYKMGEGIAVEFKQNKNGQQVNSKSNIRQILINNPDQKSDMYLSNKGKSLVYVRVIRQGIPLAGNETSSENNLTMNVNYFNMKGDAISVDELAQGTDFIAEVTVYHPGIRDAYRNLALTQIFPSGWEIHNSRLDENSNYGKQDVPTYQDIRDDRVYTYFDLNRARTRTFRVVLNASYCGKFYLPMTYCEAMYDNKVQSRKAGKWVEVKRGGDLQ